MQAVGCIYPLVYVFDGTRKEIFSQRTSVVVSIGEKLFDGDELCNKCLLGQTSTLIRDWFFASLVLRLKGPGCCQCLWSWPSRCGLEPMGRTLEKSG